MIINYQLNFLFVHIQKTAGTSIHKVLTDHNRTEQLFNNHTLMKHVVLSDVQQSLFKFAFVRNPWERLYSWYNMSIQKGPINKFHTYTLTNSKTFSEFLDCLEVIDNDDDAYDKNIPYYKSLAFNQLDYISDSNCLLNVDFIGRFERLTEDFDFVAKMIGLGRVELPHANKFAHDSYRRHFSDSDIEKVQRISQRDIDYFGYEF